MLKNFLPMTLERFSFLVRALIRILGKVLKKDVINFKSSYMTHFSSFSFYNSHSLTLGVLTYKEPLPVISSKISFKFVFKFSSKSVVRSFGAQ